MYKSKKNSKGFSHVVLPEVDVPQIKEPKPVCAICGEPISAIVEAISESDGQYSHFDCVIGKLKKTYSLHENECISYIGQGCFGLCIKNDDGTFSIKERIQYENSDSFNQFKKFVEGNKQ